MEPVLTPSLVYNTSIYSHTTQFKSNQGAYLKDLTNLGRELPRSILVDNSPLSIAQPENSILCSRYVS